MRLFRQNRSMTTELLERIFVSLTAWTLCQV